MRILARSAAGLCVAGVALGLLCGCGRIGVRLKPVDGGPPTSSHEAGALDGASRDGSTPTEGGVRSDGSVPTDGSLPTDGANGGDGRVPADQDSAAVEPCRVPCDNPHGTALCAADRCALGCTSGYADCDRNPGNGCEADLNLPSSCGVCSMSCANSNGTTRCESGTCVPTCALGYSDCDGDAVNGCETHVAADPAHCGSCSRACGSNGQICAAGECQAAPCAPGFTECDGDLAVTCETNTGTSLADCGACGSVCTVAHASPRCLSSMCQISSCDPGYDDCDGSATNGCEELLATSTPHCGSCLTSCVNPNGTTSCAASSCVPICSAGWGDCDANRPNGCERPLDTVSDCGGCGNVCAAGGGTPICTAGTCGVTCDLSGTFAVKLSVQITWPARGTVQGGNGTLVSWIRLAGTQSGNTLPATLTQCGRTVPTFSSSLIAESYGFTYPTTLFDQVPAYLPTTTATVVLSSASPGASLTLPTSAFMMGTSLADPVNGAWPGSASGLTSIDMDMNGKRGVTVAYRNGGGVVYPRTSSSPFGFNRADAAYIADRLAFGLSGTLTSCSAASGPATVTRANVRIFGARQTGGTDVSTTEDSFLDGSHPEYVPGTASYTLVRVAAGATCATVRAALP